MFQDRKQAGERLAGKLRQYKDKKNVLVLGIPRGGVETAYYIAKALIVPLDIIIVKKIGVPDNEELALGAATVDSYQIDTDLAQMYGVSKEYIQQEVKIKQQEAKERYSLFRGNKKPLSVKNKIIILVDDGMATGATMFMAIKTIQAQSPAKLIVAVPVAPPETAAKLNKAVDKVICLEQPSFFMAIGQFYRDFPQLDNSFVKGLLEKAKSW